MGGREAKGAGTHLLHFSMKSTFTYYVVRGLWLKKQKKGEKRAGRGCDFCPINHHFGPEREKEGDKE